MMTGGNDAETSVREGSRQEAAPQGRPRPKCRRKLFGIERKTPYQRSAQSPAYQEVESNNSHTQVLAPNVPNIYCSNINPGDLHQRPLSPALPPPERSPVAETEELVSLLGGVHLFDCTHRNTDLPLSPNSELQTDKE